MTKEEAIYKLEQTKRYSKYLSDDEIAAVAIAIKTLEQENILDKIRAEIMDFEEELFHRPNTDYSDYSAVRYCVEIIDKYKAERSEKE